MRITTPDPVLGGTFRDSEDRDRIFLGLGPETVEMNRDDQIDWIYGFDPSQDRIDLTRFDVTFDSVMIRKRTDTEFTIIIRDEKTHVFFDPAAAPDSLDADNFIFDTGLPDPPVQAILDDAATRFVDGTSLPDVFIMDVDYTRDRIYRFEDGKDIIDLAAFNTSFAALDFIDRGPGLVVIVVENDTGTERIAVRDVEREITSTDFTADDFIF